MKHLFPIMRNTLFLTAMSLFLISLVIWFGADYVRFGKGAYVITERVRLWVIGILFFSWLGHQVFQFVWGRYKQHRIIKGIAGQGAASPGMMSGQEEAILSQSFKQAISSLKEDSSFSEVKQKQGLYALPWYLVIGPPGSGKTTVLNNSGLEYPNKKSVEHNALANVPGVGGTRSCDWWFSNDAVFIDTAGRYTSHDSHQGVDNRGWKKFLHLLKRYRRRCPINGALITVSIQDLLLQTDEERFLQARKIRARLDELQEELQIGFPVYMIFTKCDLIAGFTDFFEDLSTNDREQVWGLTLPLTSDYYHKSKSIKKNAVRKFNQEIKDAFAELVARLSKEVIPRIKKTLDVDRQAAILNFPAQFASLNEMIEAFLQPIYGAQRFGNHSFLRGVYFTSATQEGAPIDRVMNSVASRFGFDREIMENQTPQTKHFFIQRLFSQVIFPESGMVELNHPLEKLIRWSRWAGMAALGALLFGSIVYSITRIDRIQTIDQQVLAGVGQYAQERELLLNTPAPQLTDSLNVLDNLYRLILLYKDEEPAWLHFPKLSTLKVRTHMAQVYQTGLEELLLPALAHQLESVLTLPSLSIEHGLPALKAYLMFVRPERREPEYLVNWLQANIGMSTLTGLDQTKAPEKTPEKAPEKAPEQATMLTLKQHLGALLSDESVHLDSNESLIQRTQTILSQVTLAERLYAQLKQSSEYSRSLDLTQKKLGDYHQVFASSSGVPEASLTMPSLYTLDTYESIDFSLNAPFMQKVIDEQWVLERPGIQPIDSMETLGLSHEVMSLYLRDYAHQWRRFLSSPRIKDFSSVSHLVQAITTLIDPVDSPMVSFLQLVAHHTSLTIGEGEADSAVLQTIGVLIEANPGRSNAIAVNPMALAFSDVRGLMRAVEGQPTLLNNALKSLKAVKDYLNQILLSDNQGETAYRLARARFEETGFATDPISALRLLAQDLPEPLNGWLLSIADQSWAQVLTQSTNYLSGRWQQEVYQFYDQDLKGRYPLKRSVSKEVAVRVFSDFFRKGGVEHQFVESYLTPFLDTQSWRVKQIAGQGLSIQESTLWQLKNASEIRNAFFKRGSKSPLVSFKMKPIKLDAKTQIFELSMGAQQASYKHGPRIHESFVWPQADSDMLRVNFQSLENEAATKEFNGDWALFRALENAKIRQVGRSNRFRLVFAKAGHRAVYELVPDSTANPFRKSAVLGYHCPETL